MRILLSAALFSVLLSSACHFNRLNDCEADCERVCVRDFCVLENVCSDADGDGVCDVDDCASDDPSRFRQRSLYVDADRDGVTTNQVVTSCVGDEIPLGFAEEESSENDCDDSNAQIFTLKALFEDADGDGATVGDALTFCAGETTPGFTEIQSLALDCDDQDATRFPLNSELCDGVDNDCDVATQDSSVCNLNCDEGAQHFFVGENTHVYTYCSEGGRVREPDVARNLCATFENAHLAYLETSAEAENVIANVEAIESAPLWVALERANDCTQNAPCFRWGNDVELNYDRWRSGEPGGSEVCVELLFSDGDVGFNDAECSGTRVRSPICEFEP